MPKKSRKVKKKQTKASKKGLVKKKQTLIDRLSKNDIDHTELLIKFTERAIDPNDPKCHMKAQKERLLVKLAELKGKC